METWKVDWFIIYLKSTREGNCWIFSPIFCSLHSSMWILWFLSNSNIVLFIVNKADFIHWNLRTTNYGNSNFSESVRWWLFLSVSLTSPLNLLQIIPANGNCPRVTCNSPRCPEAYLYPTDDTKTHGCPTTDYTVIFG